MRIVGRVNIRHALLALSALTIPAAAFGQWTGNWPVPGAVPPPPPAVLPPQASQAPPAAVAEPWMARPAPQGQPWQSPAAESNKPAALEPIDLPPAIEQGVDMIYIDEELVPKAVHDSGPAGDMTFAAWSGAPVDLFTSVNPIYTQLRRGLIRYQQSWGALPQVPIPDGPALKSGMSGDRVAALRTRLGLSAGDKFDAALAAKVKDFQAVHAEKPDGIAGAGTIEALNRGAQYYEQLIIINMERAGRSPSTRAPQPVGASSSGSGCTRSRPSTCSRPCRSTRRSP